MPVTSLQGKKTGFQCPANHNGYVGRFFAKTWSNIADLVNLGDGNHFLSIKKNNLKWHTCTCFHTYTHTCMHTHCHFIVKDKRAKCCQEQKKVKSQNVSWCTGKLPMAYQFFLKRRRVITYKNQKNQTQTLFSCWDKGALKTLKK